MSSIEQLKKLYAKNSKHSNYQILSDKLTSIIGKEEINVKSRFEHERLDYILKNLPLEGKSILDVGGNSGFFSFEAIEKGAKRVYYCEGNKAHADFVKMASAILEYDEIINISNAYYAFEKEDKRKYDVVLLLNVLHHLGDDYGDNSLLIDNAKELMTTQLNNMAKKTNYLVFQLGFCWKGDRNIGLFKGGTKKELIDFVTESVQGVWDIEHIGIPVVKNNNIEYVEIDKQNIIRDDSLGEFLNRPLFILRAKSYVYK